MHIKRSVTILFVYLIVSLHFKMKHINFAPCSPGCSLNRLNSVAGQYAQVCVQTAGQCGVDVIDLWSLMQKDGEVLDTHTHTHL